MDQQMMSSVNIGVSESSATNTTSDQSLQLTGAGCSSSDFLWQEPRTATKGIVNMGQEFTCVSFFIVVNNVTLH